MRKTGGGREACRKKTESGGTGGEGQVIAGYKGEGQRGEGRHKGTKRKRGGQYKFPCMYCRV